MPQALSEEHRSRLEAGVMRMIEAGESDDVIQAAVDSYKQEHGQEHGRGRAAHTMGLPPGLGGAAVAGATGAALGAARVPAARIARGIAAHPQLAGRLIGGAIGSTVGGGIGSIGGLVLGEHLQPAVSKLATRAANILSPAAGRMTRGALGRFVAGAAPTAGQLAMRGARVLGPVGAVAELPFAAYGHGAGMTPEAVAENQRRAEEIYRRLVLGRDPTQGRDINLPIE